MSFKNKFILVVCSAAVALYATLGGWIASRAQQPINDPGAQLRIFETVLQHIQNDYVDEPNMEKVRAGALRGLAYGLDPYSSYLTPEQVRDYAATQKAAASGIGAELSQLSSYLYVVAPIKGSPADLAGLHAGDIVEYIDTKATRDISLYDARQLLNGPAGSEVKLRVLRSGSKPMTLSVKRGEFKTPAVEMRTEPGKVGVLKVNSLADGQAAEVRARLQDLIKQGVQKVILDLRGTAGGSMDEAVAVANLFIADGVLAQKIGREGKPLRSYNADGKSVLYAGALVALIDGGTAGAGEVVAAALAERKRAELVGERSFGAGAEQQLFKLRDGDGLLLTTVKWASPSGKPFLAEDRGKSGVEPTFKVAKAETTGAVDPDALGDEDDGADKPAQSPHKSETPETARPAPEDLQLKKALELLRDKPQAKTT